MSEQQGEPATEAPAAVYCTWCGATPPDGAPGEMPLTWSMQTSPRGVQRLCETCTRANVRSIESKLDADWW